MTTLADLSDSQLAALTSPDGNPLPANLVPAFRQELITRGYENVDTSEIPERDWLAALDVAAKATEEEDEDAARAASHIDAVKLPDGRWAHYDDGTHSWWVVTEGDMSRLCKYLDHEDEDEDIRNDAYSHWCASNVAEEMPRGWTP